MGAPQDEAQGRLEAEAELISRISYDLFDVEADRTQGKPHGMGGQLKVSRGGGSFEIDDWFPCRLMSAADAGGQG